MTARYDDTCKETRIQKNYTVSVFSSFFLTYKHHNSEVNPQATRTDVCKVDDMRWQMGLQLNCSAADWLNSTSTDMSGRWNGGVIWPILFLPLAAVSLACLKRSEASASPQIHLADGTESTDGDGMWRLQPHWEAAKTDDARVPSEGPSEAEASRSASRSASHSEEAEAEAEGHRCLEGAERVAETVAEGVLSETLQVSPEFKEEDIDTQVRSIIVFRF